MYTYEQMITNHETCLTMALIEYESILGVAHEVMRNYVNDPTPTNARRLELYYGYVQAYWNDVRLEVAYRAVETSVP